MFRISTCMCWQTENKNMSRIGIRHCLKLYRSKLKNVQTVGKNNYFSMKLDRSNCEARLIKNHRKIDSAEF